MADDEERYDTEEQISEFWDKAGRSDTRAKALELITQIVTQRRLPIRGWMRSVIRNRSRGTGWWSNPLVVRLVNEIVCGQPVDGRDQGLIQKLEDTYGGLLPLERGVSVGCGNGSKEMNLIEAGVVRSFDLFELSPVRIQEGERIARQRGLGDKMHFRKANAFEVAGDPDTYDLVAWCDSLHHMPDVYRAVEWSRQVLKKGGVFFLSDFMGPTRFQWTDRQVEMANSVRSVLDQSYLVQRSAPFGPVCREVNRPTVAEMIELDPSEAWDSSNILPAIKDNFPEAFVRMTGGVIYHLALNDVLHNFHPKRDKALLELVMLTDRYCAEAGESHYMVALAKNS